MNKTQLIDAVATDSGLSKADSARAVESLLGTVSKTLKKGDDVSITGFGKFSVVKRAARQGVNPTDGRAREDQGLQGAEVHCGGLAQARCKPEAVDRREGPPAPRRGAQARHPGDRSASAPLLALLVFASQRSAVRRCSPEIRGGADTLRARQVVSSRAAASARSRVCRWPVGGSTQRAGWIGLLLAAAFVLSVTWFVVPADDSPGGRVPRLLVPDCPPGRSRQRKVGADRYRVVYDSDPNRAKAEVGWSPL